jgi:5-methylcytosine-specific restriction endonuclease McrA
MGVSYPAEYNYRWSKARLRYLASNPRCSMCRLRGKVAAAIVVDHIIPHKGNRDLFWDEKNWQPLCKSCHDSTKQQIDRLGFSKEIGRDGWPIDPKHPSNRIRPGQVTGG